MLMGDYFAHCLMRESYPGRCYHFVHHRPAALAILLGLFHLGQGGIAVDEHLCIVPLLRQREAFFQRAGGRIQFIVLIEQLSHPHIDKSRRQVGAVLLGVSELQRPLPGLQRQVVAALHDLHLRKCRFKRPFVQVERRMQRMVSMYLNQDRLRTNPHLLRDAKLLIPV